MPSAMRGCITACTSLQNEEKGAALSRSTLLMTRSLSKGVLLMPLIRHIGYLYVNQLKYSTATDGEPMPKMCKTSLSMPKLLSERNKCSPSPEN